MARDRGAAPHEGDGLARRGERPRVLVVDDHEAMLAHLARLLQSEFTVAGLVPDAESLLEGWARARPDVIVLDISLPGCSGLEAARRLRAMKCAVPIVFLSFHQEPEIVRAARAGKVRCRNRRGVGEVQAPARGHGHR